MVIVFLFLFWLHGRRRFNGQVILTYALLYSVIRFVIEFLRADPRGDILGLTSLTGLSTSQMISLPIAIVSLIILILRWRRAGVSEKTDPIVVSTTARA
jgi:phosphatidylglycerol:prolipoprotein diacylglycerol transferase